MTDKIKILFITSEFWQGGAQRYLFEVNNALAKKNYQTSILSLRNLKSDQNWNDYYYSEHLQIGSKIYFLEEINKVRKPTIKERIQHHLLGFKLPPEREFLLNFLNSFDVIFFIGEYTYPVIERWIDFEIMRKSFICLVFSVHQVPGKFDRYNKLSEYKFISAFHNNELKDELGVFFKYQHFYFPFSIQCKNQEQLWEPNTINKKRIGIFTRLAKEKPIDIFLFALYLLIEKGIEVELHVFGNGDPAEVGLVRVIELLSLKENVVFKGHQENICKTAINEGLDLVWFHGYYGVPGGFASFDLSTLGLPQVFWNFTPDSLGQYMDELPMYSNLKEFVNISYDLLINSESAINLGQRQKNFVFEHRNIDDNISIFESIIKNMN